MKKIEDIETMQRYPMFLDWENPYCYNVHSTQYNLSIWSASCPDIRDILHKIRKES